MAWEQFEHGWRRAPALRRPPRAGLVLMHGVGGSLRGLACRLADIWSERLPNIAFVARRHRSLRRRLRRPSMVPVCATSTRRNREARATTAYAAMRRMLRSRARALAACFRTPCASRLFARVRSWRCINGGDERGGRRHVVAYSGRLASPVLARITAPLA